MRFFHDLYKVKVKVKCTVLPFSSLLNFFFGRDINVVFRRDICNQYTVKKSVDVTVKYLASGCQFFYRYFYGRLPVEHF